MRKQYLELVDNKTIVWITSNGPHLYVILDKGNDVISSNDWVAY